MTCEHVDGTKVGYSVASQTIDGWMQRSIVHIIVEHTNPTGYWTGDNGERIPVRLVTQPVSEELGDSSRIMMIQEEFEHRFQSLPRIKTLFRSETLILTLPIFPQGGSTGEESGRK